jgi:hypothetical protein
MLDQIKQAWLAFRASLVDNPTAKTILAILAVLFALALLMVLGSELGL